MNSDTGDMRMLDENFTKEQANATGYKQVFKVGDTVQIQGCFFKIHCFVEEHNLMTLQGISAKDAEKGMYNMLKEISMTEHDVLLKEQQHDNEGRR